VPRFVLVTAAATVGSVAAVLAAMGFTAPAQAAFPGANGLIAFDASNPGDLTDQVYTVRPSGAGLFDISDFGESPAFSPDGRALAWGDDAHNVARGTRIYVAPADRPDSARTLTQPGMGQGDSEPAWSPDGRLIAFARCFSCDRRRERNVIYVTTLDGTRLGRLTTGSSPTWAVTGQLALVRSGSIYTIDSRGQHLRELTTGKPKDSSPDWAPDGQRIVFERRYDIYTIPAAGGPVRRLTTNGINYTPAFSPDGQEIVFSHNGRLQVISSGGGPPTPIRTRGCSPADDCNAGDPDWQALSTRGRALPQTGLDLWPQLGLGAALLGVGSALARASSAGTRRAARRANTIPPRRDVSNNGRA
jgi:Tol biopolymer transport system component